MVRIIPWSLPPIAGGSQGGYTPQEEDVPVTPSYFDITNIEFNDGAADRLSLLAPRNSGAIVLSGTAVSGIDTVSLVGVSQIVIAVSVTYGGDTRVISCTMEPSAPNTVNSVSAAYFLNSGSTAVTYSNMTIDQYDLLVYDGDGTIIQSQTVTP